MARRQYKPMANIAPPRQTLLRVCVLFEEVNIKNPKDIIAFTRSSYDSEKNKSNYNHLQKCLVGYNL